MIALPITSLDFSSLFALFDGTGNPSNAADFVFDIDFVFICSLIFLFAGMLFQQGLLQSEYLLLDSEGIRYHLRLLGCLRFIHWDLGMRWSDIRAVSLERELGSPRSDRVALILNDGTKTRRLRPISWVEPQGAAEPLFARGLFGVSQKAWLWTADIGQTPLVRYINERLPHLAVDAKNLEKQKIFALEKDRHALTAAFVLLGLLAYAFIDFVAGPEAYAASWQGNLPLFAVTGVVCGFVTRHWLSFGTAPVTERALLSLMIGIAAGAAMYPAALRINAWTDADGLALHEYRVFHDKGRITLESDDPRLPSIDYFVPGPYWEQFSDGDSHPVLLRKGGLGFYQFNVNFVLEEIHEFERLNRKR
jgi:hypothetical protein